MLLAAKLGSSDSMHPLLALLLLALLCQAQLRVRNSLGPMTADYADTELAPAII